MAKSALTGSRIRERRVDLGIRQSQLAKDCGISASYLNLIEHNRRRIGGKLLNDLASALGVEPSSLSQGADLVLLDALRSAADRVGGLGSEAARTEELAGRFPAWARLIGVQDRRIASLERTVETLNDRLTHDPFLSASLHDVLSTVTAIQSASAILVDDQAVDPEWQQRFHRNIHEDSQRLTEASTALVGYLDSSSEVERGATTPQEEVDAWLEGRAFHFPEIEKDAGIPTDKIIAGAAGLASASSRILAAQHVEAYRIEAAQMPLAAFMQAISEDGLDPARLADRFGVGLVAVFRRLAAIDTPDGRGRIGLVICDASGTLTFRKPTDGFPLPRFGAACALLPLYQALTRPMSPLRQVVEQPGRMPRQFLTYAIAQPAYPAPFDAPTVFEAAMLILPDDRVPVPDGPVVAVGTSCRICPRDQCPARREPSILAEAH